MNLEQIDCAQERWSFQVEKSMPFDPSQFIKLVADTPQQIRKVDVFRLISECETANRRDLAKYLSQVRPDLNSEVAEIRVADLGASKISLRAFVRGGLLQSVYLLSPVHDLDVEVDIFNFDYLEASDDTAEVAGATEKALEECAESWSEIY